MVAGGFVGVYPGADFEILPYAFVVVIVGGMGSLKGALIGSLLVGLLDNFGKALFPELSYFTLFAPMAAILAVRPTGLLRSRVMRSALFSGPRVAAIVVSPADHLAAVPFLVSPHFADPGADLRDFGDEP